jgi:hypothetical protein
MNAVIYCRVSSKEQIEGTSLESQEAACRDYARSKGACRTIQAYEVMHMLRRGQVRWLPKGDVSGQVLLIHQSPRSEARIIH